MVSLEQRSSLERLVDSNEDLKLLVSIFRPLTSTERTYFTNTSQSSIQGKLLTALANNDDYEFKKLASQISNRIIKPDSEWIHDDYLTFLLVLGNKKFGCKLDFVRACY